MYKSPIEYPELSIQDHSVDEADQIVSSIPHSLFLSSIKSVVCSIALSLVTEF